MIYPRQNREQNHNTPSLFTQPGSKAEVAAFPEHVRCSPNNRHSSRRAARLLCANNGLTHCSETATFSFVTSCLENYSAREIYDKRILNHPRPRFADTAHERKVGGPLNRIRPRSWTVRSGHSRHFVRAPITSGLPRLADIFRYRRHVSKAPTSDLNI
jgi:hypothetical protein